MENNRFRVTSFLILLVFISGLFVAMIRPFLMTILLAAIFSGMSQPLYRWLVNLFRGRRRLASLTTLLVLLVVVVAPLLAFLGVLASEAFHISQSVGPWIQRQIAEPDRLAELLDDNPMFERLEPYRAEIMTKLGQFVGAIGNFLVSGLSATTKGTISFLFQFTILLYAMYFFLKDGGTLLARILYYLPLADEDETRLVDKFVSVTRASLKGTLIIGVIQGALGGIAFAVAGIGGAVFWGTVMTVLSVIPGIGAALVWVPAVGYLIVTGHIATGLLLAAFCAGIVGTVDNFLRPRLVGRDTKMHDLLILFGTLGGILLFGVVGFIIGPILAALFVTMWDIYAVIFRDVLPPSRSFGGSDEPQEDEAS